MRNTIFSQMNQLQLFLTSHDIKDQQSVPRYKKYNSMRKDKGSIKSKGTLQNPQTQMMASVTMLHTLKCEDESLKAYRDVLIPEAELITEGAAPVIKVEMVNLYELERGCKKFVRQFSGSEMNKLKLVLKEKTKYEIGLEIRVLDNIVLGLRVENTICRGPIKINQETYAQGSYPPSKDLQTAWIEIMTPGGLFLRGNYQGEALMKDSEKKLKCQPVKYEITVK